MDRQSDEAHEQISTRLREAIRHRRAELAADQAVGADGALPDLETVRVLEEPPSTSARPGIGRVVVLWKRALKKLVLGWYTRPILGQQNDFNQAAARRLAELVAEVSSLQRRVRRLEDELERDTRP